MLSLHTASGFGSWAVKERYRGNKSTKTPWSSWEDSRTAHHLWEGSCPVSGDKAFGISTILLCVFRGLARYIVHWNQSNGCKCRSLLLLLCSSYLSTVRNYTVLKQWCQNTNCCNRYTFYWNLMYFSLTYRLFNISIASFNRICKLLKLSGENLTFSMENSCSWYVAVWLQCLCELLLRINVHLGMMLNVILLAVLSFSNQMVFYVYTSYNRHITTAWIAFSQSNKIHLSLNICQGHSRLL